MRGVSPKRRGNTDYYWKSITFLIIIYKKPQRLRNALLSAKASPSTDRYSNHIPATLRLKLKELKKTKYKVKRNSALLKPNTEIWHEYKVKIQSFEWQRNID